MSAPVQLEAAMLRQLITEASTVPLHGMKEMLRELMRAQGEIAQKQMEAQSSILERITPQSESDPLRKLREKIPNSPRLRERVSTC